MASLIEERAELRHSFKTFSISAYPHYKNSASALPSAIHDCIATGATKSKQLPRIPPIIPLIISLISQNTPKISPNVPSNTHEISKITLDRVAHLVGLPSQPDYIQNYFLLMRASSLIFIDSSTTERTGKPNQAEHKKASKFGQTIRHIERTSPEPQV